VKFSRDAASLVILHGEQTARKPAQGGGSIINQAL
jgi:hypothetical protein